MREQRSDLPAEDVDDLTDGLEADLTEQAADAASADGGTGNDAPTSPERGDPVAYAADQRAAADLPPCREPAADAHRETLVRRLGARAVFAVAAIVLGGSVRLVPIDPVRALALVGFVTLIV